MSSSNVNTNVQYAEVPNFLKYKREASKSNITQYQSVKFENGTLLSGVGVEEWHPNIEAVDASSTQVTYI